MQKKYSYQAIFNRKVKKRKQDQIFVKITNPEESKNDAVGLLKSLNLTYILELRRWVFSSIQRCNNRKTWLGCDQCPK